MRRPLIGITCDHNTRPTGGDSAAALSMSQYLLPHYYTLAVERAGGLPILLPYRVDKALIDDYANLCDGYVFSGGNDYDPAAWGEERHPQAVAIDPAREAFDRALIAAVEKRHSPILGICGGMQLMNIHRGGSLHQFLPEMGLAPAIEHRRQTIAEWSRRHAVELDRGSKTAQVIGASEIASNSSHKQAVNALGQGLRVAGTARDGVIEALEDPTRDFYIGVQWHPERQFDEPAQLRLFQELIERARSRDNRALDNRALDDRAFDARALPDNREREIVKSN